MKKILWIIFLLTISIFRVNASVYYSEYGDYTLSHQPIEESDLVDVEEVRYHKWYKNERTLLDYGLYESGGNFLTDDCYYTEPTAYSLTKPEEREGRIIESQNTYIYSMPKMVRYIHLTNLRGSYGSIRITELDVLIDGVSIDYDYTGEGCWGEFDSYIHNGVWEENESYIYNGGSLTIDLKEEYTIDKVNLIFYLFDMGSKTKTYTIGFSSNPKYIYGSKSYSLDFNMDYYSEVKKFSYNIYNMGINQSEWTYRYITLDRLSDGFINEEIETDYRYKELWCRKYSDSIVYSDDYSDVPIDDFDLKDENDYINYYNYREREKIEVLDEIIIDSDNKLEDFINTNSSYEVEGDIDYTKNGSYLINIKTDYIDIERNVIVDILENTLYEKDLEIDNLNDQIIDLNEQLELLRTSYLDELNSLNQEIDLLNEENINYQEDLFNLFEEKEILINTYNNNILDLNNEINDLRVKNIDLDISLRKECDLLIEELVNEYNEKLDELEQIKNLELSNVEKRNVYLEELNEVYYDKISELSNDTEVLNENVNLLVSQKKEMDDYYSNELLLLEEENNKLLKEKENLEKNINFLTEDVEKGKKESNDLNTEINDYVLKIDRKNKNLYILIIVLFLNIFVFIYGKLRKKSNEKKF